jgi:hypothetical protein
MNARAVTPIVNVSDLAGTFAWFEKLGWQKAWDFGSPPDFGAVCSGDCEIFLCLDGQGGRGTWLTIVVDDVDAIHGRCLAQGLDVASPPTDEPWGMREMQVRHTDGHVLRISQQVARSLESGVRIED